MAEDSPADLPYGQFGHLKYDADHGVWRAVRILGQHSTYKPLEKSGGQINSIPQDWRNSNEDATPPSRRLEKQISQIATSIPELWPAIELLPRELRVSEAVIQAANQHDSDQGTLLAFATIRSSITHRNVQLSAFASGTTASTLRLVHIHMQRRGWNEAKDVWLEVPTLRGDEAIWLSDAGPIRQIKFTEQDARGDVLLAVRCYTKTSIFRPIIGRKPLEPGATSSLSLELMHEMHIHDLGGVPHVDVAFNPQLTHQVAVIDRLGQWQVFAFQSRRFGRLERKWTGRLPSSISPESGLSDGRKQIAWILNERTIAVSSRHGLALYDLSQAETPVLLHTLSIGLDQAVSCVLDYSGIPAHSDYFCLLTSTHIGLYQVVQAGRAETSIIAKAKIRHFRNPDDLALRISVWMDGDDIVLNVSSRLCSIISCQRIRLDDEDKMNVTEPTQFNAFGSADSSNISASSVLNVHFAHVKMIRKKRSLQRDLDDPLFVPENLRFFNNVILQSDLQIIERLVFEDLGGSTLADIPSPSWESKVEHTAKFLPVESFVVGDGTVDEEDYIKRHDVPFPRGARPPTSRPLPNERTIRLERTVAQLVMPSELQPMEEVLATIEDSATSHQPYDAPPMRCLTEFAQREMSVADLDHATQRLENLRRLLTDRTASDIPDPASRQTSNVQWVLSTVATSFWDSVEIEDPVGGLSALHTHLVATWISSLSQNVRGRVRLAKEQLARSIAAELILARHTMRTEDTGEWQQSQQAQPVSREHGRTWELPVRGLDPQASSPPDIDNTTDMEPFRQVLAPLTPSPSGTPSITTASSHPSSFAAAELQRLSIYTTFDGPQPAALPRSLRHVLSHWIVGEDPTTYDWTATSRLVSQQDRKEDEEMTERERRRLQRRTERHMRRQRKEAAASQAQQIASSQVPEIVSASQPSITMGDSQAMGRAAASSQTLEPGSMAASQVVPGRFGGRPPPKKKKRKSGF